MFTDFCIYSKKETSYGLKVRQHVEYLFTKSVYHVMQRTNFMAWLLRHNLFISIIEIIVNYLLLKVTFT